MYEYVVKKLYVMNMSFYIRNSLIFMSQQITCHELYIIFSIIYI